MFGDRSQAHTLEAVVAGTILLTSIVFASQATAVTPLTASTSSQHIENQESAQTDGLLAAAAANETIKPTVLLVNNSTGGYYWTDYKGAYTNGGPPSAFGAVLNETFRDKGIAFNLDIHYITSTGGRSTRSVINMGYPTDSAVSASRLVTLYDGDPLYEPSGGTASSTNVTLEETQTDDEDLFYMVDVGSGPMFNVVEVEVTVWRM